MAGAPVAAEPGGMGLVASVTPERCAAPAASLLSLIEKELASAQASLAEDGGRLTAQGRYEVQGSVAQIGRYADSILASMMQKEICGGATGIDPTRRTSAGSMMWVIPGPSVDWLRDLRGARRYWPGMED